MPPLPPPGPARRLAVYALVVCLLAITAAVVSFARGSWLGVVWVLMAGLSSNMAWYYARRAKMERQSAAS
ncbi:hypothetical protein [Streptomyces neyagawaensis]|uniref:hypothetical protein n=2 Tax=Streptomyces neyagawaensis TaxID=42238 RepID=UPI00201CB9E3|nr:hypothetical protein [Streptomyces neyagawaensis]MCL6732648.1 hypothetical protein [Streptomyces neyagawaensis]MDE1681582.1 hypothetical protein [Streptomyces neyagawaensis]